VRIFAHVGVQRGACETEGLVLVEDQGSGVRTSIPVTGLRQVRFEDIHGHSSFVRG
jgi:hypothetical protein